MPDAEAEAVLSAYIDQALDELADAARVAGERAEKRRRHLPLVERIGEESGHSRSDKVRTDKYPGG